MTLYHNCISFLFCQAKSYNNFTPPPRKFLSSTFIYFYEGIRSTSLFRVLSYLQVHTIRLRSPYQAEYFRVESLRFPFIYSRLHTSTIHGFFPILSCNDKGMVQWPASFPQVEHGSQGSGEIIFRPSYRLLHIKPFRQISRNRA